MTTYASLDVAFVRGAGAWLYDEHGHAYLDALAGIAVCGLGHAHPQLATALADQATQLLHTSNIYRIPLQEQLAAELICASGMERAFFCNSGAEANEAAIKLARLYGHRQEISKPKIVVMENAFHGRTLAALSATGSVKAQTGFTPLVQGFVRVPYGDIDAIKQVAAEHSEIVAVLLEPIQGEGGIRVPPPGFLRAVREFCDEKNWLLMLDEVQTGMARTGLWFACQHEQVQPDVMLLAKALGNGIPIGACLAARLATDLFQPGSHGSTFGGNPFASRAALTVIDIIRQQRLAEHVVNLGERMRQGFHEQFDDCENITSIRGKGLMIGIELDRPCGELVQHALAEKLLINVTANNVIRLLPPLILNDAEADQIVTVLGGCIKNFLKN
ncbi:MAG: aspartate aminotransferase family protein [Gammaproteobacteria bacterium]